MAIDVFGKAATAAKGATVGDVLKKAGGVIKNPVGTAIDAVTGAVNTAVDALADAFGIGKGADDRKYRIRQEWEQAQVALAQQGDKTAVEVLGAIGGVKPLAETVQAPYTPSSLEEVPAGWSSRIGLPGHQGWGQAYSKITDRAASWYSHFKTQAGENPWEGTTGTAPTAEPSSPSPTPPAPPQAPPATSPVPAVPSVPSEPPRTKVCRPAPDGTPREVNPETGRCRKVRGAQPTSTPSSFLGPSVTSGGGCPPGKERNPLTGRCVRKCLYGRNASTGRCNPKPRKSRARQQLERRAEKELVQGAEAAIAAVGGPAAAAKLALKVGLIGVAGLAAYYTTKKLLQLRFKTYDELRYEASNAYRAARLETATKAGRELTPEELRQLAAWYKAKIARINEHEARGDKVSGLANLVFDEDK